ncbi:MAG: cbb3-type cytochrome oxidase assembly protein CcoS [Chitinophagales bacterium]
MSAFYLLIIISIIIAFGFLLVFLWAVKSGQFDDDYTPSVRILFEEEIETTVEES